MTRILVLNPNTTAAMTRSIGEFARAAAAPTTEIVARNPVTGPASIEGPYDEALCVPPMLAEVARGERDGCAATIIACFDDPGIAAARCIASGPVLGIAEAAMRAAAMVAARFAIVTTVEAAVPVIEELVERYGARRNLADVRAAGVSVLALEQPSAATYRRIRDCAAAMLRERRADAVILGCAGMSALGPRLVRDLGVPVIDGVAAAVVLAEGMIRLGLGTSKLGAYARPLPKDLPARPRAVSPGSKLPRKRQRASQ